MRTLKELQLILKCRRIVTKMMDRITLFIISLFVIFLFVGCEKKVEINISSPQESLKPVRSAESTKGNESAEPPDGAEKPQIPDYWFKFRGNLRNTGQNLRVSGPHKPVLKWKAKAKHEVMSSPVFTEKNETLIASHDGNLYKISKKGEMTSVFQTEETLIAAPLYISGNIYVGGFDGFFYSLDNKFNVKFKYETRSWIASSASFLSDGSVLFASNDGYLYCLDDAGGLKWKFPTGSQDYEIHSSPGVYNNIVISGSGQGSVCGIDADGKSLWHFKADSAVFASPAIDNNGNVYIGSQNGTFYSLDIEGNQRWKYDGGEGITSSAALIVDGSIVFATKKGSVICLNDRGEVKWKFDAAAPIESSPCSDKDGNVFIGCDDGKMRCIDSNGCLVWEFSTEKPILSSPSLNNESELVFGCEDKYVYCLTEDKKQQIKTINKKRKTEIKSNKQKAGSRQ